MRKTQILNGAGKKNDNMLLRSRPAVKGFSLADVPDEDKAIIRDQIMKDNRKFVIIWTCAQSVYWIFDLIMSMYKNDFSLCRKAYAGALIVCLAALLITVLFSEKNHKLIPLAAVMTEVALLGAGIGIAC